MTLPKAHVLGVVPRPLTNAECVARFVANGWAAADHPGVGVVVRYKGRVWKVAGGDFQHPSLMGVTTRAADVRWSEPSP